MRIKIKEKKKNKIKKNTQNIFIIKLNKIKLNKNI